MGPPKYFTAKPNMAKYGNTVRVRCSGPMGKLQEILVKFELELGRHIFSVSGGSVWRIASWDIPTMEMGGEGHEGGIQCSY